MSAEIIDIGRNWRYISPDPIPPDPREVARMEAELRATDRRNVTLAKRKALEPLRPLKPQLPCDHGLFSDEAAQIDLIEMLQEPIED